MKMFIIALHLSTNPTNKAQVIVKARTYNSTEHTFLCILALTILVAIHKIFYISFFSCGMLLTLNKNSKQHSFLFCALLQNHF